jgi:hypothetical protein
MAEASSAASSVVSPPRFSQIWQQSLPGITLTAQGLAAATLLLEPVFSNFLHSKNNALGLNTSQNA